MVERARAASLALHIILHSYPCHSRRDDARTNLDQSRSWAKEQGVREAGSMLTNIHRSSVGGAPLLAHRKILVQNDSNPCDIEHFCITQLYRSALYQ